MRQSLPRPNTRQILYTIIAIEVLVLMLFRPAEMFVVSLLFIAGRVLWSVGRRVWHAQQATLEGPATNTSLAWQHLYHQPNYTVPANEHRANAKLIVEQGGWWIVLTILWLAVGYAIGLVESDGGYTAHSRIPIVLIFGWLMIGIIALMNGLLKDPTNPNAITDTLLNLYHQHSKPRQYLMQLNWRLAALFTIEIVLICTMAYAATERYRADDPTWHLSGIEGEFLTSSAYQSYYSLQRDGYIAGWNPWFEYGHPNIINPFSFVTNPISTWPALIYGPEQGILMGVLIYAALAGIGGWYLGRILGLSSVGRVALGLLMIGKGNIHAMLGAGHYQLGISQAYIPWVIAGFMGMVYYPKARVFPVLTGVAFALQFMSGNIWYTLPTLMAMGALAVAHALFVNKRWLDWRVYRQWIVSGAVTVVVCAATLIPIWEYRDLVLHPDYDPVKEVRDPVDVARTLWESDTAPYFNGESIGFFMVYYSYTAPAAFLLLLFLYLPPIWPFLYRAAHHDLWRIWAVGTIGTVFGILWASGDNHVITWLYDEIEILAQFRFKGRALGIASFWLAVLIALRLDGLVRAVFSPVLWRTPRRMMLFLPSQLVLIGAIAFFGLTTSSDSSKTYGQFGWAEAPRHLDYNCTAWIREMYPDEPLAVYRIKYEATTPYIVNEIRMMPIEADYTPLPMDNTIGNEFLDFTREYPRFAVSFEEATRLSMIGIGYTMRDDAPTMQELDPAIPDDENTCFFERTKYYPYAYAVPMRHAEKRFQKPEPDIAQAVIVDERLSDTVRLTVQPFNETMIVSAQEIAYPGWHAYVDGEPVDLEVYGGMVSVIIPPDGDTHTVEFRYRNERYTQMSILSAVGSLLLALYLLRVDKWVGRLRRRPSDA